MLVAIDEAMRTAHVQKLKVLRCGIVIILAYLGSQRVPAHKPALSLELGAVRRALLRQRQRNGERFERHVWLAAQNQQLCTTIVRSRSEVLTLRAHPLRGRDCQ